MARPRSHDDELKARLLERAGRVLATEGPHALSTRKLAADVGTSTSAIYSLIGSKAELVHQIYLEGFRRLEAHLAAVPFNPEPFARLAALGNAYLDNAIDNPQLYLVMFGPPLREFAATADDVDFTLSTLQTLIDAVQDCIDAEIFDGDAAELALELWALVHGVASLAAAGLLDNDTARAVHRRMLRTSYAGLRAEAAARATAGGQA
jgi:AcrR family transcriptional regulator